jgi:hypothetical protein
MRLLLETLPDESTESFLLEMQRDESDVSFLLETQPDESFLLEAQPDEEKKRLKIFLNPIGIFIMCEKSTFIYSGSGKLYQCYPKFNASGHKLVVPIFL